MVSPYPDYDKGKAAGIAAASADWPEHHNWKADRHGFLSHENRHYYRGYIDGWYEAGGRPVHQFPHRATLEMRQPTRSAPRARKPPVKREPACRACGRSCSC